MTAHDHTSTWTEFTADDPRLTAYALGELDPASPEFAQVQAALARDPQLHAEVRAISDLASTLQTTFAAEPPITLRPDQHTALANPPAMSDGMRLPFVRFSGWMWGGISLAAAACLALALILPSLSRSHDDVAINRRSQVPSPAERLAQKPAPVLTELKNEPSPGDLRATSQVTAATISAMTAPISEQDAASVVSVPPAPAPLADAAGEMVSKQSSGSNQVSHDNPKDVKEIDAGARKTAHADSPPQINPTAPGLDSYSGAGGSAAAARPSANPEAASRHEVNSPTAPAAGRQSSSYGQPGNPGTGRGGSRNPEDAQGFFAAEPPPSISGRAELSGDDWLDDQLYFQDAPGLDLNGEPGSQVPQPAPLSDEAIAGLSESQARQAMAERRMWYRHLPPGHPDRPRMRREFDRLWRRVGTIHGNAENYKSILDNPFVRPVGLQALSTFSIDVDTASYTNIRRFLNNNQLPPRDAVRIEEMLNFFTYQYEQPSGEVPFSANVEVNAAPWNPAHRLVRIGLKGREIKPQQRPATNLVFLLDVSGSMNQPKKLPLVKQSMRMLLQQLTADDQLSIVTYAGDAGLMLDATFATDQNKSTIEKAIDRLSAGGSTNGAGGIVLAYDVARKHFISGGINRVILCTDGDFNVGLSSESDLVRLIERERQSGTFLTVLGFGTGNLQDAKMKELSKHGNGNFAYIDSVDEGRRVLVDQMTGTLVTIAKDVKIQVEFNPARVAAYRLIGYENRLLAAADFNNDRKDAGEIGAGHTVTALYEIVPAGSDLASVPGFQKIDPLKYQNSDTDSPSRSGGAGEPAKSTSPSPAAASDELMTLKIRFKPPEGDTSQLQEFPIRDSQATLDRASADYQWAAAVAGFGMILRDSPYRGSADLPSVLDLAAAGRGEDPSGYREQFIQLVQRAAQLTNALQTSPHMDIRSDK